MAAQAFTDWNLKEYLGLRKDPVVETWFLMDSPVHLISIFLTYIYFVLNLGPKLMMKRKPFDLKYLLIAYNCCQVIFSAFLCYKALKTNLISHLLQNNGCLNGLPPQAKNDFLDASWWYFFSKITELLDTMFFILRKKQSQVSFLHVYHHSVTMISSWLFLKYLPGEQGLIVGLVNSAVHVVMYFYYFLSALGPEYQKYLWWKKYMTKIQLIQFCIVLSYMLFIYTNDCQLPKGVSLFFSTQTFIFLILFSNFYRQSYFKKSSKVM